MSSHFIALEVQGTIMRYYQRRFLYLHVSLDVAIEYVGNVFNIICNCIIRSNIDHPNVVDDYYYNTLLMIIINDNKSKEALD